MRSKPSFHLTFLLLLLTCYISQAIAQKVVINEVQYNNDTTLRSMDGHYYDWIELYNTSAESIQLDGYYLKDGYNDKDSLLFSNCTLAPHAYFVVYCSDNATSTLQECHAPFKLAVLEDTVFLFSEQNTVVDMILPQCVPPDASLARWPDGGNLKVTVPSPMESNNLADTLNINYLYDSLSVNLPCGFYANPINLELKNLHPENEIRYTLDGEEVNYKDLLFTETITLNDLSSSKNRFANYDKDIANPGNNIPKAQVLRAQVFSCGCPASKEISNTYFIGDDSFTQNHPVISIITDPDNLFDDDKGIYVYPNYSNRGKEWEREAHIEIFDTLLQPIIEQDAGIRIHGAGSRSAPQKSFRLYAREEYGKAHFSYPFFSQKPHLTDFSELLIKSLRDWTSTMFKAEMCQYLVDDLDLDYSASETVIVLIDGEYWGAYNLRERIDNAFIENNYGYPEENIDLIKYTRTYSGLYDELNSCADDVFGGVSAENDSIQAYYDLVEYLYYSDPESDTFYDEISTMIDVSSFIDYLIAELYLANVDFIDNNVFFWKARQENTKWRPIFYDLDAAMSNIRLNYLSEYKTDVENDKIKPYWSTLVYNKLLKNKTFKSQFSSRYYDLLNTTFSTDIVIEHINAFYQEYEAIMPLHIYRWNNPTDITKWQKNVQALYDFAIQRPVEVFKQLSQTEFRPYELYPNPIQELLKLHFYSVVEDLELSIYTITGQELHHYSYSTVSEVAQELNLSDGLYILLVNTNGSIHTEKLMVKH